MHRWTLCMIVRDDEILLKLAARGISKGKWTGLGGVIEPGETPEEGIVREVYEESGLRVKRMRKAGSIKFYKGSRENALGLGHLFLVDGFSGRAKGTAEGELKWFKKNRLPFERMWDDDKYWLLMMLEGNEAKIEFVYDKGMKKVKDCKISRIRKIPDGKTIIPRS